MRKYLYDRKFITGTAIGILVGIVSSVIGDVREASFWDFGIWATMLAFMAFINYDAGQYIKRLRDQ